MIIHLFLTSSESTERVPISAYLTNGQLFVTYSDYSYEMYFAPLPVTPGTGGPYGPGEVYMTGPNSYTYTEKGVSVSFSGTNAPQQY